MILDTKDNDPSTNNNNSRSTINLQDGYDYQTVLDLDHNQKIELTFYGYRASALKSLLYYFILLVTCGFMALVFHWNQHWALIVRRKRCALNEAQFMLIVERYKHTEGSHHDALHSEAMDRKEEEEHEIYFVEKVHRVGVEDAKEQYLAERRDGVEKVAKKEPGSSEEAVKEKWFDRFLKQRCLFERAEVEVKRNVEDEEMKGQMSKSPDTATTLVLDDAEVGTGGGTSGGHQEVKKTEEIRIHEHFLKFLHFSVHFEQGVFEGEGREEGKESLC